MSSDIVAILSSIQSAKSILITAHKHPDLDAIGSCLALGSHLGQKTPTTIWLEDYIHTQPLSAHQPPIETALPQNKTFDLIIICDCSNEDRIHNWDTHKQALLANKPTIINIDHHPDNTLFGTYNLHKNISSVCEMLTTLFISQKWPITADIATYLYAGIVFDTDRFLHPNTTPNTLNHASHLIKAGARSQAVHQLLYENLSEETIALIRRALNNLEILPSLKTAITTIPKNLSHIEYKTIDLIRQMKHIDISIVITQTPSEIKVNLRSKTDFSVSTFAQQFGGGGHHKAAGISFSKGSTSQIKAKLIKHLKDAIQI